VEKGILLPIFSLPNKYGCGDFGYETYEFIDILSNNNIKYWQILPIFDGIYPYSPISFYALNINYIFLDKLKEMKLLDKIDKIKEKNYLEAYHNFVKNEEYYKFIKNEEIIKYAKYMSNKNNQESDYYLFLQYILDKQWNELLNYAHSKNVYIIGDLPIYPDFNSCELYYYSKYYQLNNGKLEYVSGASPDYFNRQGQKWNHPLYDFNQIKEDKYIYLLDRYKECLKRFDITRIDHFRAYDNYYKIPIDKLPTEGFYEEGPKEDFFDKLFKITDPNRFIVEDLGDLRKETYELKHKYNFKGMKILQYTLNLKELKDDYNDINYVVYTGNHDNNTIVGWYNELTEIEKSNLIKFLKKEDCLESKINFSLIKYALNNKINLVIVPVQDIIGLDSDSRINLPGIESNNNWSWQLENFVELKNAKNIQKK